jgi:hypothetical protein
MKMGNYMGSAWKNYVALPVIGLAMSFSLNAQRYDGDIRSTRIPDINNDGVPEVMTTVNNIYDHTNRVCLLKSGHADDMYSELGVFNGNILKTKSVYDSNGKFRGVGVKTAEGNGRYYIMDISEDGKFSAPRRVKGREFRKS